MAAGLEPKATAGIASTSCGRAIRRNVLLRGRRNFQQSEMELCGPMLLNERRHAVGQPAYMVHRMLHDGLVGRIHRIAPSSVQTEIPTSRATPSSRASVPASAWPVTASGRQCRWNARSTVASAGSSGPSGTTR